jgi:threonine/homoserine/homoserine lactone efflux protein
MIVAFILGLVCGFVGSIPVAGPTGVLILERGLHGHRVEAFEIAVGAAVAEAGYALLAFLGMTAALSSLPWLLPVARIVGAVLLLTLGLYYALARRHPPHAAVEPKTRARRGAKLIVGLLVTAVNPTLLATWSAVVTMLHSTQILRVNPLDGFPFALGVGGGMVLWFAAWLALVGKFRDRIKHQTIVRLVKVMGWLLVAIGVALLVNLARTLVE